MGIKPYTKREFLLFLKKKAHESFLRYQVADAQDNEIDGAYYQGESAAFNLAYDFAKALTQIKENPASEESFETTDFGKTTTRGVVIHGQVKEKNK